MKNVRDALIQIVLRLRDDALKDKDGASNPSAGPDPLYAGSSGLLCLLFSILQSILWGMNLDMTLEVGLACFHQVATTNMDLCRYVVSTFFIKVVYLLLFCTDLGSFIDLIYSLSGKCSIIL